MKTIDELLELSPEGDKQYYGAEVANLCDEDKQQLQELANYLHKAGAKSPISWAFGEVTEGRPQLTRFLLLRNLYEIIKDQNGIIAEAAVFDEDIEKKMAVVNEILGDGYMQNLLYAYGKAIMSGVIGLLDGGNYNHKNDNLSWMLTETDAESELTGRTLNNLHEDFLDFED